MRAEAPIEQIMTQHRLRPIAGSVPTSAMYIKNPEPIEDWKAIMKQQSKSTTISGWPFRTNSYESARHIPMRMWPARKIGRLGRYRNGIREKKAPKVRDMLSQKLPDCTLIGAVDNAFTDSNIYVE